MWSCDHCLGEVCGCDHCLGEVCGHVIIVWVRYVVM